jgi:hypothetical protein
MEMMILSILPLALQCQWGINQYRQAFLTTIVFIGTSNTYTYGGHDTPKWCASSTYMICMICLYRPHFILTACIFHTYSVCILHCKPFL